MDLTVTLTILAIAAVITAAANLLSRRPEPIDKVWSPPYNAIQFVGFVVIILMLAHLVTLLTGVPFAGRMGG